MSKVTELPPHENMSVNQVLDHTKRKDLKKVFIIGIDPPYDKTVYYLQPSLYAWFLLRWAHEVC